MDKLTPQWETTTEQENEDQYKGMVELPEFERQSDFERERVEAYSD